MPLSQSYGSLVKKWFPNARMVADRFHVVRVMRQHFITLCRDMMGEYQSRNKVRALLGTNPENLTQKGKLRLATLFLEFLALKPIYNEIQQLTGCSAAKAKRSGSAGN